MSATFPIVFDDSTKPEATRGRVARSRLLAAANGDMANGAATRSAAATRSSQGVYEKEVLKIKSYPEVKVDTVKKCRKVLGKKICVNVPQGYRRTGTLSVYLVVTYPKGFEREVRACAVGALSTAVIAGLASGNFAAAINALKPALTACLTAKGSQAAGRTNVKFVRRTTHTPWKKI